MGECYYYDYTYFWFMVPALVISLYAGIKVRITFAKYSNVRTSSGMTGADAAIRVLSANGVNDVFINRINGDLNDHFDPRDNTIRLSDSVYSKDSVAAVGVAAHEAGHAVQHASGYGPIKIRQAITPISQFGSVLYMPLIFIGIMFPVQWGFMVNVGIIFFSLVVLFQLITLPVELDASRRALVTLKSTGVLSSEELVGAKKVLTAAAMTYLAATLTAILSLLRLLTIAGGRRGRN